MRLAISRSRVPVASRPYGYVTSVTKSVFIFAGKKGKKSKGKVLSLNEFLSDDHGGPRIGEAVVLAPSKTSWADEMEEGKF